MSLPHTDRSYHCHILTDHVAFHRSNLFLKMRIKKRINSPNPKKAHHSHHLFPLIPHFLPHTLPFLPSPLQYWTQKHVSVVLDVTFNYLTDFCQCLTRFGHCNTQISVDLLSDVLILCDIGLSEREELYFQGELLFIPYWRASDCYLTRFLLCIIL